MPTLDIRISENELIDKIVFAETQMDDYVVAFELEMNEAVNEFIWINEEGGDCVRISKTSIPNLIKALQKAQEIWGNN